MSEAGYSVKYFDYCWEEISAEEALNVDHYVSIGNRLKSVYVVSGGIVLRKGTNLSYAKELHIPIMKAKAISWDGSDDYVSNLPEFDQKIVEL